MLKISTADNLINQYFEGKLKFTDLENKSNKLNNSTLREIVNDIGVRLLSEGKTLNKTPEKQKCFIEKAFEKECSGLNTQIINIQDIALNILNNKTKNPVVKISGTKNQFDLKEHSNACPIMSLLFIENSLTNEISNSSDIDKILDKGNQSNNDSNPNNQQKNIEEVQTKLKKTECLIPGNNWEEYIQNSINEPGSYGISITHNNYTYAIVRKEDSQGKPKFTFFDSHGHQKSPAFIIQSREDSGVFLNRIKPFMHLSSLNKDFSLFKWTQSKN